MRNIFFVFIVLLSSLSFGMFKSSQKEGATAVDYEAIHNDIWEGRLAGVQMYLYLDTSGSMRDEDNATKPDRKIIQDCGYKNNNSKWTRMDTMKVLASYFIKPMLTHDDDKKIPAYLFSDDTKKVIIEDADEFISSIENLRPRGQTELEKALRQGFHEQEEPTVDNRALHVVFTDGAPTSVRRGGGEKEARIGVSELIEDEIVNRSYHLNDKMSVLFIQVGDSEGASVFLRDLDNCEEIGRCVDTKNANEVFGCIKKNGSVAKVLENGIFEDVDGIEER
jgi:hypothetical protein